MKKKLPYIILVLGLLLWLYRLKYFIGTEIPLGYDPGIYKQIFISFKALFWSFDFSVLPQWMKHEPGLPLLANFFNMFWISFDRLVRRGIWIISLLPGVIIFLFFRRKNIRTAIIAATLYWVSIAQYEAFFRNYFKQIFAITTMLWTLFMLERKNQKSNYIWFWILLILTFITHRHTALFTWIIIFFYLIKESIETRKIPRKLIWTICIGILISFVFYAPMRKQLVLEGLAPLLSTFQGQGTWWEFMDKYIYLKYSFITLWLALIGAVYKIIKKQFDIILIWLIIGLIRIWLGLFNFNRTLIFLDIFVIISAAQLFWTIRLHHPKIFSYVKFWMLIIVIWLWFQYTDYIKKNCEPLISQAEFQSIKLLETSTEPNAIIMTSHRNYMPRIMWYSNRDRISPGRSDIDQRSFETRIQRRESDWAKKCNMLHQTYSQLEKPLYLWLGEMQRLENLEWWSCFELVKQEWTYKIYKIQ